MKGREWFVMPSKVGMTDIECVELLNAEIATLIKERNELKTRLLLFKCKDCAEIARLKAELDDAISTAREYLKEARKWKAEFEEGHRAWAESDEHKNADELRGYIDRLEERVKELEGALNNATNNQWSQWELDRGRIEGENLFLALQLQEFRKEIQDFDKMLTESNNKLTEAQEMIERWWR